MCIAADEKSKMRRSKNVRFGISSRDHYNNIYGGGTWRAAAIGSRLFIGYGHQVRRRRAFGHEAETRVAVPGWRLFVRTCLGRSAGPNVRARGTSCVYIYIISMYKYTHTHTHIIYIEAHAWTTHTCVACTCRIICIRYIVCHNNYDAVQCAWCTWYARPGDNRTNRERERERAINLENLGVY